MAWISVPFSFLPPGVLDRTSASTYNNSNDFLLKGSVMILDPQKTTIAYRCPSCGGGVISAVGMFYLGADMVKLKCTCGECELTMVYTGDDKVRLSVPCLVCPKPHSFTVSRSLFFGRDLFVLP